MKKAIFTSVTSLLFTVLLAGSALAQAADQPTGKLVVYTSQAPEIAQQTMDAFKAAYPDIQVEWTRNGTTQLMNVLHTEMMSGRVKPDVLLVADAINLGALKKEQQLYAYQDAPVGHLKPSFYDRDKTFLAPRLLLRSLPTTRNGPNRSTAGTHCSTPITKGKSRCRVRSIPGRPCTNSIPTSPRLTSAGTSINSWRRWASRRRRQRASTESRGERDG